MSRTAKPVPMCCVSIGHLDFLMPAAQGMKLVELMNSAVSCERSYEECAYRYQVGEQPQVEYVSVRPNQVVVPTGREVGGMVEKSPRALAAPRSR